MLGCKEGGNGKATLLIAHNLKEYGMAIKRRKQR